MLPFSFSSVKENLSGVTLTDCQLKRHPLQKTNNEEAKQWMYVSASHWSVVCFTFFLQYNFLKIDVRIVMWNRTNKAFEKKNIGGFFCEISQFSLKAVKGSYVS